MKTLQTLLLTLVVLSSSCSEADVDKSSEKEISNRQITIDQDSFDQAWSSLQTDEPLSDPCELNSLAHVGTTLIVGVSYSGGCEEHGFELIWPEVVTMIYPPRYTIILNHDDKDDLCEAYPSDTLYFDLSKYDLGITPEIMDVIDLTLVNGSNGEEILKLH